MLSIPGGFLDFKLLIAISTSFQDGGLIVAMGVLVTQRILLIPKMNLKRLVNWCPMWVLPDKVFVFSKGKEKIKSCL